MVEIMNSSFIPKKEFRKNESKKKGKKINIFFLISLIIFLITIITSMGVYLWKISLQEENKNLEKSFESSTEEYGIETIKKFSRLHKRIVASENMLKKHYNVLPIFDYLERNTLVDINLTQLSLKEKGGEIMVSGKGVAPDLTDLQLQSSEYAKNPNISYLSVSKLRKNRESSWEFNLDFSVDKKYLTTGNLVPQNNKK